MRDPEEEARLEQTKMSFGEHLEELRRALFKSIFALVLGTLAGLWWGGDVVAYIQTPLREALERFYLNKARQDQVEHLEEQKRAGEEVPADIDSAAAEMVQERLVPRRF